MGAAGISAPAVTSFLSHEVLREEEGKREGWALPIARSARREGLEPAQKGLVCLQPS